MSSDDDETRSLSVSLPSLQSRLAEEDSGSTSPLPELQATQVGLGKPWGGPTGPSAQKKAAFQSIADCKRFWRKCVISFTQFWEGTPCWNWIGALTEEGYGIFSAPGSTRAMPFCVMAHRSSYESYVAPIPDGLTLDHLCRNRRCSNPLHLEPVTQRENSIRALPYRNSPVARNKAKVNCVRGHPLSGDNLIILSKGRRDCRACRAIRYRIQQQARELKASRADIQQIATVKGISFKRAAQSAALKLYWESLTQEERTARLDKTLDRPEVRARQRAANSARKGRPAHKNSLAALHSPESQTKARASYAKFPPRTHCKKGHPFAEPKRPQVCKVCTKLWRDSHLESIRFHNQQAKARKRAKDKLNGS